MIVVPSSASICSKLTMWSYRLDQRLAVHELHDPDHQHVLVVAPVEDDHLAVAGNLGVDPPQVVVGQLVGGRFLERRHPDAGRVDTLQHPLDRARPYRRRPIRLEDDEHPFLPLRPQQLLQRLQPVVQLQ